MLASNIPRRQYALSSSSNVVSLFEVKDIRVAILTDDIERVRRILLRVEVNSVELIQLRKWTTYTVYGACCGC